MTPIDENPTKLDKLGIWVSSLCALHCLALPVLIPLLPLVGSSFFAQVWFERTILTFSLIVGAVALISGAVRYHGKYYPLILLFTGGAIYWHKDIFGHHYEPFTIALGAALIVAGHWFNMRLCRQCKCCKSTVFSEHLSTELK
ncbi:MerC protein [Alteromonas mediterranea]|uniref:MerC protein n=1 Tax=Alteromonas mediterranea TaxID=314275 RepID=A0AAC9NQX9_9ALTE|nr:MULTISPECIES: MerC domain-containing protein [Alteromonas]MEA3382025.1 MerC domain-containing protein [Pseudomonadota bacterium]APD88697.1 MerC protein [Alteromonas mediterranea]APD92884.1 MerC protein [Alteromonas mediterranea]APD96498.1 MerC protein [Alteromonas mediterranea]APE00750.1 MerC protein [Alteromonas mediterranea]|tara:strand:+ start:711 stop:1139 length:429 start_codon:yes stop_codon:yes gene_type:complete